jgi:hypothetical protein
LSELDALSDGGRRLASYGLGGLTGLRPAVYLPPPPALLFELVLSAALGFLAWPDDDPGGGVVVVFASSTDRRLGANPFVALVEGDAYAAAASCSARDAFRMHTVRAISVIVTATWLAAASRRETGDMPALVACVLLAATRLLRVASARSRRAASWSTSTSERSRAGRPSKARTSSTMEETAFTTAFMGVKTRVGALERPAVRSASMPERKAVT